MRIAINALSVRSGGGVTLLKNLIRGLLSIDQENEYLILITQGKLGTLGLSKTCYPNLKTLVCPSRGWVVRSCWEQTVLPSILRREKVDVLYSPGNQGPVLLPFPFVVLIQNVDPLLKRENGSLPSLSMKRAALRIVMRASVHKARRVIAISEFTRRLLAQEFACNSTKVTVIPHGPPEDAAETPSIDELARTRKFKIESPYFLAVSNIRYNKNYENLIYAFHIARSKISSQVKLVIAGDIEQRACFLRLKHIVQRNGIDSLEHFLGEVDQGTLRVLYIGSLGLVFPSRLESFGLPPLEAMAYGVPVAAARIDPVVEVCGDAAVYFNPNNPQEIAEAMMRLMKDKSLRKDLTERGRMRAKLFSWRETARRTLEVLQGAVG